MTVGLRGALLFASCAGAALGDLGAQVPLVSRAVVATPARHHPSPGSALSVHRKNGWTTWWSSDNAPRRWSAPDSVLQSVVELHGRRLAFTEISIAGSGEAWRTRLVVVRLDPRALRLELDTAAENGYPAWRLDRVPADAVFAINAGQFGTKYPWGLVLLEGHQYLAAGAGALVTTIAIDSGGAVRWASGDSSARVARGAQWAFQSYPTLLRGGDVPLPIQDEGRGVDLGHRDARVAMGLLPDGNLLFVMTRFDALGTHLGFVPFGLTVPEMAAVMGALGARDAVLLDGGVSAQMLIREDDGMTHLWRSLRAVPLALVARPRPP